VLLFDKFGISGRFRQGTLGFGYNAFTYEIFIRVNGVRRKAKVNEGFIHRVGHVFERIKQRAIKVKQNALKNIKFSLPSYETETHYIHRFMKTSNKMTVIISETTAKRDKFDRITGVPFNNVEGNKADYSIVQDVERQDDFNGIT